MDLLILGGTRFLGRHLAEEALERGHRVTLFNRGESNPGLFREVEELRGERGGRQHGGRWQRKTWWVERRRSVTRTGLILGFLPEAPFPGFGNCINVLMPRLDHGR